MALNIACAHVGAQTQREEGEPGQHDGVQHHRQPAVEEARCRPPREAQDEQRPDGDHEGQEQLRQRDDEERDAEEDDDADREDRGRKQQVEPEHARPPS